MWGRRKYGSNPLSPLFQWGKWVDRCTSFWAHKTQLRVIGMLIDCRFLAIMVEHPIVVETFQANVGPGWKARASPKSLGFIICEPWMSRQNFINSSMWDFSLDQSSGPIVWQTNITIPWPCLLSWLKNKEMQEAGNTHRLVAQTEATLAGHSSTHWEDGDGGGGREDTGEHRGLWDWNAIKQQWEVDCVMREEVQIRRCLILFAVYLGETQAHTIEMLSRPLRGEKHFRWWWRPDKLHSRLN